MHISYFTSMFICKSAKMSAIEISETVFQHCNFVSSRKCKITGNGIPKSKAIQEQSQKAPPLATTINISDEPFPKPAFEYETLLLLFFKISYFLGMVPYYWKTYSKNGWKSVKQFSGKLHLIVVIPMHMCAIMRYMLRFFFISYDLRNPFNYFKIARTTLSTSLCSFFLWSIWRRQHLCKEVMNRLANLSHFPNETIIKRKSFQYAIILTAIALLCITSLYRSVEESQKRWGDLCSNDTFGQEKFCIDEEYESCRVLVKVLIGTFNYIGRTIRRVPRLYLLVISLSIWQVCKSFARTLRKRNKIASNYQSHEIVTVLVAYEELKSISNLIRDLVGEMLISEIAEDIVYFSLEVQLRLRQLDWFSIFVVVETWMVAFVAYFIAACAAEHIQEVSVWLARDDVLSILSPGKVSTLHTQLYTNPVGMKGGSLFTITKSFLANVVTVWVTYFIILLQFQIGVVDGVDT